MKDLIRSVIDSIFIQESQQQAARALAPKREVKRDMSAEERLKLAYAIVLVDFATIDNHLDAREYRVLSEKLPKLLGVKEKELPKLISKARTWLDTHSAEGSFVEKILGMLPAAERDALYAVVRELVDSDGKIGEEESELLHHYERLLKIVPTA